MTRRDPNPSVQGHPDRPPEPTADQFEAALRIVRRLLGGERLECFTDAEDRVCAQPLERGDVERMGA